MPRRLLLLGVALVLAGNAEARPATTSGAIVSIAADGSGVQTLSTGTGRDAWPSPSPDGRTIAFVHREGPVDTVRVVAADGSGERELGGGPLVSNPYSIMGPPVWSPDGRELIVSALIDVGDPRTAPVDVIAVPLAGGPARDLHAGGIAAFSRDGRYLAYETRQVPLVTTGDMVGVMHADGTHAVSLGYGTAVAWSPAADRFVFSSRSGVSVAGPGGRRSWTLRGVAASALAWLPKGTAVVFIRAAKRLAIVEATVGRQKTRRLADLPTPAASGVPYTLSVSPNGRWVAASLDTVTFVVRTDGSEFRLIQGGEARWAPSGSTLALVSGTELETWTDGLLSRIQGGVDPAGGLAWSPDGTRIYYAA